MATVESLENLREGECVGCASRDVGEVEGTMGGVVGYENRKSCKVRWSM